MLKKIYTTLFLFLICNNVQAKNLEHIFEDWHVLTSSEEQDKICYIVAVPKEESGNYTNRSKAYLVVSKFKDREPEISISGGYPYQLGSEIELLIKNQPYFLRKIEGELAWAENSEIDKIIINAMKAGSVVDAKATSTKGTYSIDTYSLMGFTKSYSKMLELCK